MAMTVTELAEQVRDSNERLTEAVQELRRELTESRQELRRELTESRQELRQELGELRAEFAQSRQEFSRFRVEVAEKLGAINTNLETLKTRVENSLSIAKWAVTVIIPVVLGVIVWSYTAHERLARIESSIISLRDATQAHTKQIEKLESSVVAQSQQIQQVRDSVMALRDVTQVQGKQIEKLESSVMAQSKQIEKLENSVMVLRDVTNAHSKQIEELVKMARARPPALDASGIKELTEQIRSLRDELKKSQKTNPN